MTFHPMLAAVLLFAQDPKSGEHVVAGSGAAFHSRDIILTANHCIPDDDRPLLVQFHGVPPDCPVLSVERNPELDLALLRIQLASPLDMMADQFYLRPENEWAEGTDVAGWGYPAEAGPDGQFVRRFFKGHIQRTMVYDWGAKKYWASEFSFPIPQGLSGGVIAPVGDPRRAIAVATTNHGNWITVESYEEETRGGITNRGEIRKIVEYGIGSNLITANTWLDEVL